MTRFTNLEAARLEHAEHGGILLDQGDHYLVGWPPGHIGEIEPWINRSGEYLDSLAPSWDETHPDNQQQQPAQIGLAL